MQFSTNFVIFVGLGYLSSVSLGNKLDNPNLACDKWSLGLTAQQGPSPYEVFILQNLDVAPGDSGIEILLMAPVASKPFVGFIVDVFYNGGDPTSVGRFNVNNSDSSAEVHDCSGQLANVMTHTDLSPKRRVKLEWIAPLNGQYYPVVTFFQSGEIYWVNQRASGSGTIKVISSGAKRYLPWAPMQVAPTRNKEDNFSQVPDSSSTQQELESVPVSTEDFEKNALAVDHSKDTNMQYDFNMEEEVVQ